MDKKEAKIVLMSAIALGFVYQDGKLICTLEQLCAFSSEVTNATANQIMIAFNSVKET